MNTAAVPKIGAITVERVLDTIKGVESICAYLPDLENIKSKHMSRRYLFDIVNTLEPTYFRRCMEEVTSINRG